MSIIIIVNIITSLAVLLGGLCMKKYSDSPADYSIGFRTKRAMASSEAWYFANQKCGKLWMISGTASFAAAIIFTVFIQAGISSSASSIIQFVLLILQITADIFSTTFTEYQLKRRFDNKS